MKAFFKLLEKTAGPIGIITATVGGVLDFLAPLGPYIYVLAVLLFLMTIFSVVCNGNTKLVEKAKNKCAALPNFIKQEIAELWQPEGVVFYKKGLFQILAFFTILTAAAGSYAGDNSKGFLATKIESVADLQSSFGLISSKLDEISLKQDELIDGVDLSNKKLELVKKETSEDPRKELANLGVAWDSENFWDALVRGDSKVLNLFIDGDFRVSSDDYYEANLLNFINKNGNSELLKQLLDKGVISKDLLNSKYSSYSVKKYNDIINKELDSVKAKNLASKGNAPYFHDVNISPLLSAVWEKNQKLVSVLISHGAKVEDVSTKANSMQSLNKEFISVFNISISEEARINQVALK